MAAIFVYFARFHGTVLYKYMYIALYHALS